MLPGFSLDGNDSALIVWDLDLGGCVIQRHRASGKADNGILYEQGSKLAFLTKWGENLAREQSSKAEFFLSTVSVPRKQTETPNSAETPIHFSCPGRVQ